MAARDDNDEGGFRQTTIRSTFDKVSKRMSLYEYGPLIMFYAYFVLFTFLCTP